MILPNAAITEHGELVQLPDWQSVRRELFERNLILLAPNLSPFLRMGAAYDLRAQVNATKNGAITSISVREDSPGRRIRSIVCEVAWGTESGVALMQRVRALMTHCQCGDRTTPSQLGIALMRETWQKNSLRWHWAAPKVVQETLRAESCPPRTESPGVSDIVYPEAHEFDLNNAFASHFRRVPAGRTIMLTHISVKWRESDATWFRWCQITVPPGACKIGPLPKRDAATHTWTWPRSGSWYGWLWKEQADQARLDGCQIQPGPGWAWLEMTEDTSTWCDEMTRLKDSAPSEVAGLVKKCIVSAIGYHAIGTDSYQVQDEAGEPGHSRPYFVPCEEGESPFSDLYLVSESSGRGTMIHWQRYSIMQTNQTLYRMACQFTAQSILQVNFDSLLTTESMEVPITWKHNLLKNATLPYARAVISDSKIRLPGIPRSAHGAIDCTHTVRSP